MIIHFEDYKSTLFLNGEPPRNEDFAHLPRPWIAADGAGNYVKNPDLIIGDLDSISPEILMKVPHKQVIDQDHSDFEKALSYIAKENLLPTIICGLSGGTIDHVLNNLKVLSTMPNAAFVTKDQEGLILNPGIWHFELPQNTKLSLFGLPKCNLSTTGLKWELEDYEMEFFGTNSCFNRTTGPLEIEVHFGRTLLICYRSHITDAGEFSTTFVPS